MTKYLLITLTALFFVSESMPAAHAVVCAHGVRGAGCAGAAVVHAPRAAVVRAPVVVHPAGVHGVRVVR